MNPAHRIYLKNRKVKTKKKVGGRPVTKGNAATEFRRKKEEPVDT